MPQRAAVAVLVGVVAAAAIITARAPDCRGDAHVWLGPHAGTWCQHVSPENIAVLWRPAGKDSE